MTIIWMSAKILYDQLDCLCCSRYELPLYLLKVCPPFTLVLKEFFFFFLLHCQPFGIFSNSATASSKCTLNSLIFHSWKWTFFNLTFLSYITWLVPVLVQWSYSTNSRLYTYEIKYFFSLCISARV